MTGAATGTCVAHPGQPAFVTCSKCGNLACAYCLADDEAGDVCAACAERAEGGGRVAWERSELSLPARFWRTLRTSLGRSGATFSRLTDGPLLSGLTYTALLHALYSLAMSLLSLPFVVLLVLGWELPVPMLSGVGALVGWAICVPTGVGALAVSGVVQTLLLAGIYHGAVLACGGRGGFALSLRAVAYGLSIIVIWIPIAFGAVIPYVGAAFIVAGLVGQLVWLGHVLGTVASHGHALEGARARIAGWAPSALGLAVLLLVVALRLLGGALEPSHAPDEYSPVVTE